MALATTARVSGPVLRVERRTGTRRDGSGERWAMTTVTVLVEQSGMCEVTLDENDDRPGQGEMVDWLVEFRTRDSQLNCRFVRKIEAEGSARSVHAA